MFCLVVIPDRRFLHSFQDSFYRFEEILLLFSNPQVTLREHRPSAHIVWKLWLRPSLRLLPIVQSYDSADWAAWARSPRPRRSDSLCCLQHLWKHPGALSGALEHLVTVIIPPVVFSPSQQNHFLLWLSHCSVEKDGFWGKRLTGTLSAEKLAFQLWNVQCRLCPGSMAVPQGQREVKAETTPEVARWRRGLLSKYFTMNFMDSAFLFHCRHT